MSNKKSSENPNPISTSSNNNNPPNAEAFSFLELDNFLSQEISKKDNNNKSSKKNLRKKESQEKDDKKHKLRFRPNRSLSRGRTSDDLMYIESEDKNESIK